MDKLGGTMDVNLLKEMGFDTASQELEKKMELKLKMTIAYENFRFVTPEIFKRFNDALKERTLQKEGKEGVNLYHNYDKLNFIAVNKYKDAPPVEVLEKMAEAKQVGCFDRFEIAKIESVHEYKDPIVFGVIEGCDDRFFVAQWDDDVKIEQILNEMEG